MATTPRNTRKTADGTKKNFRRRVNIFFARQSRKEVLTFLCFVVIASFFWIFESAYEETTSTYKVEFLINNQPSNIVFTTLVPETFNVTIKDINLRHFSYYYKRRHRTLQVDFTRYADALGNFRISSAELRALLQTELQTSTQIVAVAPTLIDARYAITEGKKVAVILDGTYAAAPNHRCRAPQLLPDSVIIHAPSAISDTLSGIHTHPIAFSNLTDTLQTQLSLRLPLGVKSTPGDIRLTIPVSQYVEKTFIDIPITSRDVPDSLRLTLFPATATLTCLVDLQFYRQITADIFDLTVSYDSIHSTSQRYISVTPSHHYFTDNISNIRIKPDSVEFVIEER